MKEMARENEALKKRLASLERGGSGAAGASSSYEQLEAAHSAELRVYLCLPAHVPTKKLCSSPGGGHQLSCP